MLWTLQWYIFREMGKAFLLTAIGLTAVLGLGGGVMNMIEAEQVTAHQFLQIMMLILPVAGALTLPVAALFSATVTYGRLSADNELVACKASGINIHYLFLPTIVISVVSALVTFFCVNYVIPGMISNLDRFIRSDAVRLVEGRLRSPGRLPLGEDRYRIYANQSQVIEGEKGEEALDHLVLSGIAYLEMEKGAWARYGTAQRVDIRFDMASANPVVEADMYGLSYYDRHRRQWLESAYEGMGPYEVPQRFPMKLKWMDLSQLVKFRRQPQELPNIRDDLEKLRAGIARALYYQAVVQEWSDNDKHVRLGGDGVTYTLWSGNLRPDTEDGRPLFIDGVTVTAESAKRTRTYTAAEATVVVGRGSAQQLGEVSLHLFGGVQITDPDFPDQPTKKPRERLDAFPLPPETIKKARGFNDRHLLDADSKLDLGSWVEGRREKIVEQLGEDERKIAGLIHSRIAFSASVLVLVVLGAALGILFRGSHVLTAFGLSFIPSLFIIVTIIMGRQMANNPGTAFLGILVMWGSIVVIGLLDGLTLWRYVRR